MSSQKKSALFICLGNICRSPIAEAVFIDTVSKAGDADNWEIDSAAIGPWHAGKKPDHRAQKVMQTYKLQYNNTARQIKKADFERFDYIFGMDDENISDLNDLAPKNSKAKILLLGEFDPNGERIIRDPYYDSNSAGFEKCYQQCVRCCAAFLEKAKENKLSILIEKENPLKILFVCIGNSCRSPMAESVLKNLVSCFKLNWFIDSAAIADWNVGLSPEPRCITVLEENGLTSNHIARQIDEEDYRKFDYIFGMDDYNISDLKDLAPSDSTATVQLLGSYDYNNSKIIIDPYFEQGIEGFRTAYVQILRSCENFIKFKVNESCQ